MKVGKMCLIIIFLVFVKLVFVAPTYAHFGVILPSDDIVTAEDDKKVSISLKFMHPMEGVCLEMAKPKRFAIYHHGGFEELTPNLKAHKTQSCTYWKGEYTIKRPGDYIFFMEPTPYWEATEDKYIVHYTKVWVNGLCKEEEWDTKLNLPIEIVPLVRPYGLWTGNVFQGLVLVDGKPAPYIEVEVEYMNAEVDGIDKVIPPADPYVTQVIKTDANGVFTYAMPRTGWWGFAALVDAPWKLKHNDEEKGVEIGGVVWVHVVDMK